MVRISFKTFFILCIFVSFSQTSFAQVLTPIKVLLVPGHDDKVWGAQYGKVKEANMNVAVASRIYNILAKDERFEVHITRNVNGYTKEFTDYFVNHQADILAFKEDAKKSMKDDIAIGTFVPKTNVPHRNVSEDIAIRLYGFNKWADENKMDAMIHIHFNDYVRPSIWTIGRYSGFTIYFPDSQFSNSTTSKELGLDIFSELSKKYVTSTYPDEKGGFIPDQKLIAIGANNTLISSVHSVLIEYGYISEKRLRNYTTRHQAYNDMAKLTVAGITNYFFGNK